MPFSAICSGCHATLKVPDNHAGEQITCPRCGIRLPVSGDQTAIGGDKLQTPSHAAKTSGLPKVLVFGAAGMVLLFCVFSAGAGTTWFVLRSFYTPSARQPQVHVVSGGAPIASAASGGTPTTGGPSTIGDSPTPTAPPVAPSDPTPAGRVIESLKGNTTTLVDIKLTTVKIRSKVIGSMFWADDKGTAFYAIDSAGVIRKVTFPGLEVVQVIELDKTCTWLAPSSEGLVASISELQEIWVIDPGSGKVKKKIAVPSLKRAASAASLSVAIGWGDGMHVVDLKSGQAEKLDVRDPGDKPVVSPDGKHVYTQAIMHWSLKNGQMRFEQAAQERLNGLMTQVSIDSKYVSAAGVVYSAENVERPLATLRLDGNFGIPLFGADPASGNFYAACGRDFAIYDGDAKLLKRYPAGIGDGLQMLVHPAGGKMLVMGSSKFVLIEAPK